MNAPFTPNCFYPPDGAEPTPASEPLTHRVLWALLWTAIVAGWTFGVGVVLNWLFGLPVLPVAVCCLLGSAFAAEMCATAPGGGR